MTRRGVGTAAAGLLMALAAAGCRRDQGADDREKASAEAGARRRDGGPAAGEVRRPEIARLTGVKVEPTGENAVRWIRGDELAGRLAALLTASPAFLSEAEAAPDGRVVVPAAVVVTLHGDVVGGDAGGAKSGPRRALVGVEAEVDWKSGERLRPRENLIVERPLTRKEEAKVGELVAEIAEQALDEAGRGLVAKETLRQGEDAAVLTALDAEDPDTVLWALELCAERRIAGAFARAVALLDARDPGVRGAALRVLVALRDPRAVAALARKADFADPDTMRALVEAVTAIGGSEAIEFLEMMAGGHADPDLRQRAQEGLERLGRRQQERRGP
jgi:HEAT repeats